VDFTQNCKEIAYNAIPMFKEYPEDFKNGPFFHIKPKIEIANVLQNLVRKCQIYKTEYFLFGQRDNLKLQNQLLEPEIRYMQYTSLSFTFLDWTLMEQVCAGKINIASLNDNIIRRMLYNIYPGGNTIIHNLIQDDQQDAVAEILRRS
jgi:hypothetical protein